MTKRWNRSLHSGCFFVNSNTIKITYCHFFKIGLNKATKIIKEQKMSAKVKIFTLSTCSHCKATKKFLNDNGITFDYVDVDLLQGDDKQKILQEVEQYNPQRSFPTIIIGDNIIIGFRESDIREALGI
jgi:glutaredoxin